MGLTALRRWEWLATSACREPHGATTGIVIARIYICTTRELLRSFRIISHVSMRNLGDRCRPQELERQLSPIKILWPRVISAYCPPI